MVNIETLYHDMRDTLHWSDPALYSKHYHLPDQEKIGDSVKVACPARGERKERLDDAGSS